MHLSLMSDGFMAVPISTASDDLDGETRNFGRAHRDGLVRGALFLLALVIPLAMTVALSPAEVIGSNQPRASVHK